MSYELNEYGEVVESPLRNTREFRDGFDKIKRSTPYPEKMMESTLSKAMSRAEDGRVKVKGAREEKIAIWLLAQFREYAFSGGVAKAQRKDGSKWLVFN